MPGSDWGTHDCRRLVLTGARLARRRGLIFRLALFLWVSLASEHLRDNRVEISNNRTRHHAHLRSLQSPFGEHLVRRFYATKKLLRCKVMFSNRARPPFAMHSCRGASAIASRCRRRLAWFGWLVHGLWPDVVASVAGLGKNSGPGRTAGSPLLRAPEKLCGRVLGACSGMCQMSVLFRKVSGEFITAVEAGDWETIPGLLSFQVVAQYFLKVGVAPNVTEVECAEWLSQVVSAPLAARLRQGRSSMDEVKKYAFAIGRIVGDIYSEVDTMRSLITLWSSVVIVIQVAEASEGAQHSPSATRKAIQTIMRQPSANKIGLAFQHGELGIELIDAANQSVAMSAQEEIAINKLAHCVAKVEACDAAGFFEIRSTMIEALTAATMLSASSLEGEAGRIVRFMKKAIGLGERWYVHAMGIFPATLLEQAGNVIELVNVAAEASAISQEGSVKAEGVGTMEKGVATIEGCLPAEENNKLQDLITTAITPDAFVGHIARLIAFLHTWDNLSDAIGEAFSRAGVRQDVGHGFKQLRRGSRRRTMSRSR